MKPYRKLLTITIFWVLTLVLLVGCGKIGQGPRDVLSKYLDALFTNNSEESYKYLSAPDKAVKRLQDYSLQERTEDSSVLALMEKISFEIKDVTVTGKKAKANVDITTPDISPIMGEVFSLALMSAFSGESSEKDMERLVADKFKDKDMPMTITAQSYDLVREAEGWKVFLDLETKEKIDEAMKQAEAFEESKQLHAAKEKYLEVLALDSKMVEAAQKAKEIDNEIQNFEEKKEYIQNVELYDLKTGYYSRYSGEIAGVEFKVRNKGNRTLTKVEVTVYFKDAAGNVIAEEDYHPVSEYSFNGSKPLKPNYIWQIESGKFYQAKSVPTEWEEGNASAKITDIEFGDDTSPAELNSTLTEALSAIDEVSSQEVLATHEVSRNVQKEKEEYIAKHLLLQNIRVGEGYGAFDIPDYSKPKKGIFGTIKNTGDKNIGYIQVTVYYLDSDGRRVGEKASTVLSTSSLFDADPPLRPNYSKDFGYIIEDDASPAWDGKIEAEITKIKFEGEND